MQYTAPHYYKKFQCIGGDCPDTCCAGWQIQIDPASLRKYRKTKGPLGSLLGFVALPPLYFAFLIPCILLYMALATSLKKAYVRHYGELL